MGCRLLISHLIVCEPGIKWPLSRFGPFHANDIEAFMFWKLQRVLTKAKGSSSMAPQKKFKVEVPDDLAIPLLDIDPKELKAGSQTHLRYLYTLVHSSITHSSQRSATRVSTDRWVDKNVVCVCDIIHPWKKFWHILQHGWSNPEAKGQILYDPTDMWYPEQANSSRQKVEVWQPGVKGGEVGVMV